MNAELISDELPFFAPVTTGILDGLVAQYQATRQRIEQVASLFDGDVMRTVAYFIEGNRRLDNSRYSSLSAEQIFKLDGAVAALNADYWSKAMSLTDVWDCMPQKRRDEWSTAIHDMTCPDFEEETVLATFQGLISSRSKFFAERIDGIFRALSHEHVTNSPMGFGKRMIVNQAIDSFGLTNHRVTGHISDLRCVIAKFMGRDEPHWSVTNCLIHGLRGEWGVWHTVDGGAMRIRLYKKGTAHLEIHPDMAWRLNAVLASLYPQAIPAKFRTKPQTRGVEFTLMERPLPFAVLQALAELYTPHSHEVQIRSTSEHVRREVETVLEAIGGVAKGRGLFIFDYAPTAVLNGIIRSGCIPDDRSHQFYPTPPDLAAEAVALADIGPNHTCLEPSAGNGGLADSMPKDRTTCVEISDLRCKVLDAKGYRWLPGDFLTLGLVERFDRVIMNPPFNGGRAEDHVKAAAGLLKPGGRLVAILPESATGKDWLPGFDVTWGEPRGFPGTSISVVVMVADNR